jgi:hypothetical protein
VNNVSNIEKYVTVIRACDKTFAQSNLVLTRLLTGVESCNQFKGNRSIMKSNLADKYLNINV